MDKNETLRILIIDDNPSIHHDFIKILTTTADSQLDRLSKNLFGNTAPTSMLPPFQIDTASQGKEGLERIKQGIEEQKPYSLAFVDIRMPPGWDGIETIKQIWEVDKDIQIVICTAYSDYSWEETVENLGKKDNLLILKKPFDTVSVRQLACALTKKWQLMQENKAFTTSLEKQIDVQAASLQQTQSLVKATLESSAEGIIVLNEEDEIVDFNKKFCTMWNIDVALMENKSKASLEPFLQTQLKSPSSIQEVFKVNNRDSGEIKIELLSLKNEKIYYCYSQPQVLANKTIGRVFNFRDITEITLLENKLKRQATHDYLTNLPNRVMLLDKIRDAIHYSSENKKMFALMFLDLDRFKLINDSLGHAAGDVLLQATATRIKSALQEQDTLARLGGDEFVILLTEAKSEEEVIAKAQKILSLSQTPYMIEGRPITVTTSIGISLYPRDGNSADVLLRNADTSMYSAKELGSNHFKLYTKEMNKRCLERLDKEMQIRQGLQNNEFFLVYQPQFDLTSEKLIAVEALVRWNHPEKGLILPMDFIPLTEETGLIISLGEWALRTACKQNKAWQEAGFDPIRVAINITGQQLKQANIVEIVKNALAESGLDPAYLELELTENIIVSSAEIVRTTQELKKLGVAIAIDDFGTGYSSLSYLKKLPLDRLKIDGSFIKNIQSDLDDEVIIRAIIAVAKNLNLDVLAEGVESHKQLEFLKKQNCDEIQGYYFSKPLSTEDLKKLLTKKTTVPEKID